MENEFNKLKEKFLSEINMIENIDSLENFVKEVRTKFYSQIEEERKYNKDFLRKIFSFEDFNRKIFSFEEQMIGEIAQSPDKQKLCHKHNYIFTSG